MYKSVEKKLLHSHSIIKKETIGDKLLSFIPLHRWLSVLLQLNLLLFLVTTPSALHIIGDITTGTWFKDFLFRCPPGWIPIAVDIYYDHWQVSDTAKLGGLYIAIANACPSFLMQPDNKFVVALVPEGFDVQVVLQAVLHDFLSYNGLFEVEIDGVLFHCYVEICCLIGDIPGLAELCGVLNHRVNSPCCKCKVPSSQLLVFESWEEKTQQEIRKILASNIPLLEVHGHIGKACEVLKENGLKGKIPTWMWLPSAVWFDFPSHSVACLLHNEELGNMLTKIIKFSQILSPAQYSSVVMKMAHMPCIPGLPYFKKIFLLKEHVLLGKEVITLTKYI